MTNLDARYGRTPRRRGLVVVIVAAAALVAAALAWFIWANPLSVQEFWRSSGYRIEGDRAIEVTWEVTLDEGQTADCAIAAQNEADSIVGWKVFRVIGTAALNQSLTETIRTTERADTGLAYRCWLV